MLKSGKSQWGETGRWEKGGCPINLDPDPVFVISSTLNSQQNNHNGSTITTPLWSLTNNLQWRSPDMITAQTGHQHCKI